MNHQSLSLKAALWAACLLAAWPAHAAEAPHRRHLHAADDSNAVTDRLIVKYRAPGGAGVDPRSESAVRVAGSRAGLTLLALKRTATGGQVFHLGRGMTHAELRRAAARMMADVPEVEYAEPDRMLQPQGLTNDSLLSQQWSLADPVGGIRATTAWDRSIGTGVVVAVIDTGVRPHADLVANLLPGYDFIGDTLVAGDGNGRDADAYDPGDAVAAGFCGSGSPALGSSWHGTHVAGIVAAVGGNGAGIAGIAHGARILPARVLGRCGGYVSDIASAMIWASGGAVAGVPANVNPARVINLSLGGSGACDMTTQAAIDTARARGAVVVVAAGNASADVSTSTPANCAGVVTVAATQRQGGLASYSNRGGAVSLSAPGGDGGGAILSTLNAGTGAPAGDSYAAYMGTSMAAPAVSATAALMLAAKPTLSADQVAALLKSTARAFPVACAGCGSGIVDAAAAVAAAVGATPPPALPPPPTPTVSTVAEVEPNNTQALAQKLSTLPLKVNGGLSSRTDTDHFQVSLPAGVTLTAVLTTGAASNFSLNLYTAGGKLLASSSGTAGQPRQLSVRNISTLAVPVVFKVLRSAGSAGAYQLSLSN